MIRWLAPGPMAGICPVCGTPGGHQALVEAPHPVAGRAPLRYARCTACASVFPDQPGCLDYKHEDVASDRFLRHYLEIGAGIHAQVRRSASLARASGASFLEVGCGYGFAVDLWRRMLAPDACGIESASYGRAGAQRLGITVHDGLLGKIPALEGRRFDIVQAIEVIEHVPDTRRFLDALDASLAPGGTLVLSTPAAEFVDPRNDALDVEGALFPGFHAFVFSAPALRRLLRKRYVHVDVRVERETLSCWASNTALDIDPQRAERVYLPYLDQLACTCVPGDALIDGLAYRLFKEKINRGDRDGALSALRVLEASYAAKYGADLLDPEAAERRAAGVTDLAGYDTLPYALGPYHYFRGQVAVGVQGRPADAARHFHAAHEIGLAGSRVAPLYFMEAASLVWIARFYEGMAWAAAGDQHRAMAAYAAVSAACGDVALPVRPSAELAAHAARMQPSFASRAAYTAPRRP